MGYLLLSDTAGLGDIRKQREDSIIHKLGCQICPLKDQPGRMEPTGVDNPLIYMLGEAPGKTEIEQGEQFVGESGDVLRPQIPRRFRDKLRWNNVVRSRPSGNKTPDRLEIEACRPSVLADIEKSKPKAIFGFGNIPLHWVSGFSGITLWRGRRMPVKVGNHVCWYYAFNHPAAILHELAERGRNYNPREINTEGERMLRLDLARAFAEVERLPPPYIPSKEEVWGNTKLITVCNDEWLDFIEDHLQSIASGDIEAVGIDYETNALRPYGEGAKILSAAVSDGDFTLAFPFDHADAGWTAQQRVRLDTIWLTFLKECKPVKVAHNLAFELEWSCYFYGNDLAWAGRWADTAIQANILDERTGKQQPGPFALEFLVQQYFGFNVKNLANVDVANLAYEPLEAVLRYNGPDAKYGLYLWEEQDHLIRANKLYEAYHLALRRVPTLVLSQLKGVPVDQTVVTELDAKYAERIKDVQAQIADQDIVKQFRSETGRSFNPESAQKDVLYVFDTMLKCPEVWVEDKYTHKEKLSVDDEVLTKIEHPLSTLIQELRKAVKRKSTYIDALKPGAMGKNNQPILWPDGQLHAVFNTYFAQTGRLSCQNPNLQNFPKREEEAREVRRPIRCKDDEWILAFDYGQLEARVIAMFTRDKRYVDYLWNKDSDLHMDWALRIAESYPDRIGGENNLSDKKVMKVFRTDIKNQWTFPAFFGARLESLADYLNIPVDVMRPHYRAFWEEFAETRLWQEETLKFYREYGYVETLTGRRRHGPLTVNMVYNSGVQGTAAEIVLDGMSRLSQRQDPLLQPEINIHDDLTFVRVPKDKLDYVVENVLDVMLDVPFEWAKIVPMSAEASIGRDWENMEEFYKVDSTEWFK